MKKIILTLSIIICLFSTSLLRDYKISVKASPNVIYVPDDYAKIQWAIDNATDGDTIFVRSRTYTENIVINKSVTLIGEDKYSTCIDGSETESVIFIKAANNVNIQGFTLKKSGTLLYNCSGVLIERSNGSVINNNIILTNYNGISLYSSGNTLISNNILFTNVYGIALFYSSNTAIHANNISKNFYDGISLYWSTNNTIHNNAISDNSGGISLYWSSSNVISANTIINNPSGGINLFSSSGNMICYNNFNNIVQVSNSDSTNSWSCKGEGNYWSDYVGEDLNRDGIGDTSYVIDDNNADNNPLMGWFSEFDITYKGETYYAAIISNSTVSDFQFQIGVETGNRIIRFKLSGNESTIGFCRVTIPTELMSYLYLVLLNIEEISPTFLDVPNETHTCLYFTYLHENQTITIISSEPYRKLLDSYYDLNETYYNFLNIYNALLYNCTLLLDNYTQLQKSFGELNATFYDLANACLELQRNYEGLNVTYYGLFNALILLWGNYTQLQEDYQELNASYQDHLRKYSENVSNVQNLTYVLAAVTAILIIVTTYLSKCAHSSGAQKIKRFGEE